MRARSFQHKIHRIARQTVAGDGVTRHALALQDLQAHAHGAWQHDIGRDSVGDRGGQNPGQPVIRKPENDEDNQPYAESADPVQKFGKENMDMAMNVFGAWAKNAQAIATEVADYSKKSFEDSAAAFEKLIGAKSVEKAVEVQTEYLRSSYEELVAETAKIGELYADLAREAYKPFESVLMKMPGAK